MEEKYIENFIREFERQMFWKKFREEALFVFLRFISFFMVLCCTGISLLYIIERRAYQIEVFSTFFLILFTSYAILNTDFFVEENIKKFLGYDGEIHDINEKYAIISWKK